jgi:hypothetical protein
MNYSRRTFLSTAAAMTVAAKKRRIVFVAGKKTHGYGEHDYSATSMLLARLLNEAQPQADAVVHKNGWPEDPSVFDGASLVVVYMDGGEGHPMLAHIDEFDAVVKRGAGVALIHYALDVPPGKPVDMVQRWIGGAFEVNWSVNPAWTAKFAEFPKHPITRGVKPFAIFDEWYYNMRFVPNLEHVTPLLTAVPPDSTRKGKDGPYSGNPTVRAATGRAEHVSWAYNRAGGGRGFGFTGLHYHWALANDGYRKYLLNALSWTAGLDVPASGIETKTPTWEELLANQEGQMPAGFTRDQAMQLIRPR